MRVRSVERSWKNDVVRIIVFQSSVIFLSSILGTLFNNTNKKSCHNTK